MKKIITYSVVALALVSSSLVYAQNSSTVSEYTPVVISNFEKTLPQNKCQVPSTKLAFGDGLKNGKTAQVKILQEHLIGQGYLSADATGYFGPLTLSPVKKFQKKEGVISTGYVGPLTLGKIKQKCSLIRLKNIRREYSLAGRGTLKEYVNLNLTWNIFSYSILFPIQIGMPVR